MSENLKVNANSSVLEHKRKHNLLVDAVPQKDTDGNYKIFENIVDSQGHPRFIEGDIELVDGLTGFTQKYGKWSLSGSHLLIVVAFDIANGTVFAGTKICEINVPEWIYNKIVPLYSPTSGVVSNYGAKGYNEDFTNQEVGSYLNKAPNQPLSIYFNAITASKLRSFRLSYDLLIDNEEPETQGE